ncbi:UNKNOWN [Stylonychia lemnae]|uniref:Uncharacterized protein n=1 Tax=Stylonychia lemnae TaxID=5949 RepID=A0A078AE04_STYLE|nr:UNKNOWN [Stylonychia lemnae]|eukprot:CDW80459.1 UNKNOWN [Stylonychia lemnae]
MSENQKNKRYIEFNESYRDDQQHNTNDLNQQQQIEEEKERQLEIIHKIEESPSSSEIHQQDNFTEFVKREEFPKKAALMSVFLLLLGGSLITLGFLPLIREWDPTKGLMFWLFGSLLFVSGLYYVVTFFKAYKAHDDQERLSILREIPEI